MTHHLRPVGDDERQAPGPELSENGLPIFEGQMVDLTRVRLSAANNVDVGQQWSRIDDTVRFFVEGTVVRIDHVVETASGKLVRVHTIKVIDAVQLPWEMDIDDLIEE